MGYLSTATVLLDFSALADGQRGGLFCTGSLYNGIGISREEGKNYLYLEKNGDVQQVKMVSGKKSIYVLCWMQRRIAASCSIVLITVILFYVEMLIR